LCDQSILSEVAITKERAGTVSSHMRPTKQRVLTLKGPRQAQFSEEPLRDAGPDDVIIRSLYSTLKHGTEMLGFSGKSTFLTQSFDRHLRLFAARDAATRFYPQAMGNMVVGEVEFAGARVEHVATGQRVFAWAPVADVHVLPARSVEPLGNLTHEQALSIDPASFALGGVIDGAVEPNERVLVTGLGAIGLFVVQYCRNRGATTLATSTFEGRRKLAQAFGASRVYDTGTEKDLGRSIKVDVNGVDIAIECSGKVPNLRHAIRATRQCGRVVCSGIYGSDEPALNLGEEFLHNRLTLLASLPALSWNNPTRGPLPQYAKDLQAAVIDDFRNKRLSSDGILHPVISFHMAEEAPKLIADAPGRVLKVMIDHT
jgi:threonine dehydrogenase-like Zn-dependent dehydrogenase